MSPEKTSEVVSGLELLERVDEAAFRAVMAMLKAAVNLCRLLSEVKAQR